MTARRALAVSLTQMDWRPLAHVALKDGRLRSSVAEALRREGCAVVDSPTGYHLLQSLSGLLLGKVSSHEPLLPDLIVVDAFSPGCCGLTIAQGLRDLGWSVPALLVVHSPEHRRQVAEDPDRWIYVAESDAAVTAAIQMARQRFASHTSPQIRAASSAGDTRMMA